MIGIAYAAPNSPASAGRGAEAKQPRDISQDELYSEEGFRRHLTTCQVLIDAASNTAVRTPSRPSMRLRPKLAESCAKSGPITTPRFGEGCGPGARSWAIPGLGGLGVVLPCQCSEAVKRSDQAKGFVTLPKRWIVERTIAWLNRCRRLAKDWENLNLTALMFLRFASIRLMLRRLCNPA
jgi:Transposase DDE domain